MLLLYEPFLRNLILYIYIVIGSLRHGLSKKFPGESSEVFLDNGDVAEENNRELLDVKKNFDGLEKWTNNLEQRKSNFLPYFKFF